MCVWRKRGREGERGEEVMCVLCVGVVGKLVFEFVCDFAVCLRVLLSA